MVALRWLRCEIGNGMFTGERAIKIALAKGRTLDAFVPSSEVEADPQTGQGRVRVRLVSVADGCWVLLPQENPNPVSVREVDFVG